jgi:hypothetical protein
VNALVQMLAAAADGELPYGVGVVAAVNMDGTLQVTFRTATLDSMHRLASYTSPMVGDTVLLLHGGGQAIILGAIV